MSATTPRGYTQASKFSRGDIRLFGQRTSTPVESALARIHGRDVAMISQNPVASLNPIQRVGLSDPAGRFFAYPHELSGWMCQRVMIAMAIACHPRLLLGDEPTTALDATIQAQIVELQKDPQRRTGKGLVFVAHDFGVVAEVADRVAVMYAGRIAETVPVEDLFRRPGHPCARALMQGRVRADRRIGRLSATPASTPWDKRPRIKLQGEPPAPLDPPSGRTFHPRRAYAAPLCSQSSPALEQEDQRATACHFWRDLVAGWNDEQEPRRSSPARSCSCGLGHRSASAWRRRDARSPWSAPPRPAPPG